MHPISGKDSDPYAHITETPADVAKLMQQEKKVIGSQKQVGKTSEESYQGGGTILSFGSLAIQSKIPASFYRPDIEALLKQKAALSVPNAAKPTVLIYHSHTTEATPSWTRVIIPSPPTCAATAVPKIWCGSGTNFALI